MRAFALVHLLNLPAFFNCIAIKVRSQIRENNSWKTWRKDSFLGRWTGPTLERWDLKDIIIKNRAKLLSARETNVWTRRLGLSTTSPLWTWITSGFVHMDLKHLAGNMAALCMYASICERIPGMSAIHVGAVTVGSSLCASAAQLLEWHARLPLVGGVARDREVAMGASGIVSAFAAIVAAAVPWHRLRIPILDVSAPIWVFVGMQVLGDVVGLFRLDELVSPRTSWQPRPRVGYAAHLGGALFGLVYYYAFLHGAESKAPCEPIAITEDGTVSAQQEER